MSGAGETGLGGAGAGGRGPGLHVIGTAGHVDHGKTLLIEALTGINADRLPEERERGMTIDLGFAHFQGPGGSIVGVVDVPGHERFIRNMVAGAWSLDCALLAVAADDGWMQQSGDHARVLRLMGVPRLILVVTKTDLAAPERVEEVQAHSLERLRALGYLEAPALPVAAARGEGIEALRQLILSQLAATERAAGPFPLLYVDRVFTVRGAGVVVTGTLTGAPLEAGQSLLALPQGREVRVRGIQSYYRELRRAEPRSRVALNLSGAQREELFRGTCLTVRGAPVQAVSELVMRLADPVPPAAAAPPDAAGAALPLRPARPGRRETQLEIAFGTDHRIVSFQRLPAGLARVVSERPMALRRGQPVVLIRHGGSQILGGGTVIWTTATTRAERHALSAEAARLPAALSPRHLDALELAVRGRIRRSASLPPGTEAVEVGPWLVRPDRLEELERAVLRLAGRPGGVTVGELGGKLEAEQELLAAVCRLLLQRGELVQNRKVLLPRGAPEGALSPFGRKLLAELRAAGPTGLEPRRMGIGGAAQELRTLARSGLAVPLQGEIFLAAEVYAELAARVLEGRAAGDSFPIGEAKERSGLSRKYLIPLLNRMETDGWVRRRGDLREVVRAPEETPGRQWS